MDIHALYRKPNTSLANKEHKVYPYLLRDIVIDKPNEVFACDITYIPMAKGFIYLMAVIDWHTRKVLAWRLSNTMTTDFCLEALDEAIARYGAPKIFNTDQGSQFTSEAFTARLKEHGIQISMDGKGRWVDNVFVERLWRSVKYEEVYLKAYASIAEAKQGLKQYFSFYNSQRPHQGLGGKTPDDAYFSNLLHTHKVA
jgi:putative transposase